ncbi:MAG TPA: hypothetical protein VF432_13435 [Thermoanaerobaculia bacterium]
MSHIPETELAVIALMPGSLSAERRAGIAAHLAECAACRRTHAAFDLSEEALEAELRDPMTWEPIVGSETHSSLTEYHALIEQEDRDAADLLKPYLANPINAAWEGLVTKPDFRTAGVVRALIDAAHATCESKPLVALVFAENAVAIAEVLDDERYLGSAADQLRGTACKEQANAEMLLGRLPAAHLSLDSADRYYRRCVPNTRGLAIVALVRAGVFYQQERLQDAMPLAEQAEVGFAHAVDDKRRMDAVFLRGAILFEAGRAAEAVPLFRQVIDYGEETRNVRLIARGSYAIGDCQLALGNLAEATVYYHRALVIFREAGPERDRLATEWGIARVVLRGGKYADAIIRLRALSTAFEQRGMVTDAALVGLDIIEAFLVLGKPRSIVALAQHLFTVFTNAGMLTGALSALAYLKEAATTAELTLAGLEEVRSFLRRAERQPYLQFVRPRPRPEDSV